MDVIKNLYEAKTELSSLVERAAKGEEIVIAKKGEPMAKLVRYEFDEGPPRTRLRQGKDLDRRRLRRAAPRRHPGHARRADRAGCSQLGWVQPDTARSPFTVMPALDAGIHRAAAPWIAGSSPAMTALGRFRNKPLISYTFLKLSLTLAPPGPASRVTAAPPHPAFGVFSPCAISAPGAPPRRSPSTTSCSRASPATAGSMCRRTGRGCRRPTCARWRARICRARRPGHAAVRRRAHRGRRLRRASSRDGLRRLRPPAVAPLKQLDGQHLADGAVPRPDARLQGRGAAAAGPALRPCAAPARPARHHRRRHLGRHRLGRDRGVAATAPPSTSSSCIRNGRVSEVQRRQMTTVLARQRPQHRRRGHLRRLPGPGEGDVQRPRLPRRAATCRR